MMHGQKNIKLNVCACFVFSHLRMPAKICSMNLLYFDFQTYFWILTQFYCSLGGSTEA